MFFLQQTIQRRFLERRNLKMDSQVTEADNLLSKEGHAFGTAGGQTTSQKFDQRTNVEGFHLQRIWLPFCQ